MNTARASLGTLLVQRLDTLLGTTLSQQSNLVLGARPDAVSQPAQTYRSGPADNKVRRTPQENIHRAAARVTAGRTPLTHPGAEKSPDEQSATSAQLRLGATARLILDLLAQYPRHMPVEGKTPLLDASPGQTTPQGVVRGQPGGHAHAAAAAQTAALTDAPAALLRQTLVQLVHTSGMFYESHLAQLVLGQRRAESLLGEPQAHASAAESKQAHVLAEEGKPAIAPDMQTVVRQQLEVLAQQTFAWQGQVWPGADMRWDIRRHPSPETSSSEMPETPECWESHLTLDLPTLGRVHARLTLGGAQVLVHVQAADCAPRLQQHADALRERLCTAGIRLRQLSITADAADASSSDAVSSAVP